MSDPKHLRVPSNGRSAASTPGAQAGDTDSSLNSARSEPFTPETLAGQTTAVADSTTDERSPPLSGVVGAADVPYGTASAISALGTQSVASDSSAIRRPFAGASRHMRRPAATLSADVSVHIDPVPVDGAAAGDDAGTTTTHDPLHDSDEDESSTIPTRPRAATAGPDDNADVSAYFLSAHSDDIHTAVGAGGLPHDALTSLEDSRVSMRRDTSASPNNGGLQFDSADASWSAVQLSVAPTPKRRPATRPPELTPLDLPKATPANANLTASPWIPMQRGAVHLRMPSSALSASGLRTVRFEHVTDAGGPATGGFRSTPVGRTSPPPATEAVGSLPPSARGPGVLGTPLMPMPSALKGHSRQVSLASPRLPRRTASFILPPNASPNALGDPKPTPNIGSGSGTTYPQQPQSGHFRSGSELIVWGLDETDPRRFREMVRHVRQSSTLKLQDRTVDAEESSQPGGGFDNQDVRAASPRTRRRGHHRRISSYLSEDIGGQAVQVAVTGSTHFPSSDFHRKAYAGALTVLSEVVEGRRRVFRPRTITVTVGDTVLFRWFGNHQLVQVDEEGLPMAGGFGADQPPRRNGELPLTFDEPGVYQFESLNHHKCLRATVHVKDKKKRLLHRLGTIGIAAFVVALFSIAVTLALAFFVRSRYIVAPEAPKNADEDDGNGSWRLLESIITHTFFPWACGGVVFNLVVLLARAAVCFRRRLMSHYGRGYPERVQQLVQATTLSVAVSILIFIFAMWITTLQINFGFATFFGVMMNHVGELLNEAISVVADVRYLIRTGPSLVGEDGNQIPASAVDLLTDVEGIASTLREWVDVGEDLVRAVFRIAAILAFIALHLYLYVVAAAVVAIRRRRSTTMWLAFTMSVLSTMCICMSIGFTFFMDDLVNRTIQTAVAFSDATLTEDKLKDLTGAGKNSPIVTFFMACGANGPLSIKYIDERVSDLVNEWNRNAPGDFSLIVNNNTVPSVIVVNEYMDLLVSQIEAIDRKLAMNSSLLSTSLVQQYSATMVPALRAALRVTKTVLSLVDCQVLRRVLTLVVPVLRHDVHEVQQRQLGFQYVEFALLLTMMVVALLAVHVFDRPYKFWFEPRTNRWFRFRACYLAHRRLLHKAREEALLAEFAKKHQRLNSLLSGSDADPDTPSLTSQLPTGRGDFASPRTILAGCAEKAGRNARIADDVTFYNATGSPTSGLPPKDSAPSSSSVLRTAAKPPLPPSSLKASAAEAPPPEMTFASASQVACANVSMSTRDQLVARKTASFSKAETRMQTSAVQEGNLTGTFVDHALDPTSGDVSVVFVPDDAAAGAAAAVQAPASLNSTMRRTSVNEPPSTDLVDTNSTTNSRRSTLRDPAAATNVFECEPYDHAGVRCAAFHVLIVPASALRDGTADGIRQHGPE
jgi:plastocyanin